ncbi:related to Regulator of V-ATPase in vacuolar membrane protein 2 [Saccharomycodes ludwigii]|uniref:Related to Regulator of V-ATPase in vacuolar membrane protein 2 n=1 Tax=Saccharomycodes ludwigii TaxID=36035 RepID=A0A376B0Z4_9ASCO|nr:hypothetical protein SCDLUD_001881 [Saccharomycodes ludwigii]KAH3902070.1 hypothetical protein SCDLUD_001881 [Saccharomycodes ludwigii]SSD58301.1 related to Regulator of V-ATPase in vacuolar membrane protein 2 [Saccharomycodes ludwigii]
MTTKLYPNDYFGTTIPDINHELDWLIKEIIKPQLPDLTDTLETCLQLLTSEQTFKLPITNKDHPNSLGELKGTLTRQSGYIIDYQLKFFFPDFHRGKTFYLSNRDESNKDIITGKKILLQQLSDTIENIKTLIEILETLQDIKNPNQFKKVFQKLNNIFKETCSLLNNPSKNLLFPNFALPLLPQLTSAHHVVVPEIIVLQNELHLEFRCLENCQRKPWSEIDATGKSLTDRIKQDLVTNRQYNLSQLLSSQQASTRYNDLKIVEPSFFHNLAASTNNNNTEFTMQEIQNYLTQCVTYQNKVYLDLGKIICTTSDPYLISVCSKLQSLNSTISNHYSNLVDL